MADLTLKDGREITFDLYQMSIQEWDQLRDPDQPKAEEYATLGKVAGMTAEEVAALPYPDFRKFTKIFIERCSDPLA